MPSHLPRSEARSRNEALAGVVAAAWAGLFALTHWRALVTPWPADPGRWASPGAAWVLAVTAACLGVAVWGVGVATGAYYRRPERYGRFLRALGALGLLALGSMTVLAVA